jgi:hypothetical protein
MDVLDGASLGDSVFGGLGGLAGAQPAWCGGSGAVLDGARPSER